MKRQLPIISLLCTSLLCSTALFADSPPCSALTDCMPVIAQFLQRLGANLGFTLTNSFDPTAGLTNLIDVKTAESAEKNLVQTQLGALTIATTSNNSANPTLYNIAASNMLPYANSKLDATFAYVSPPQTSSTPTPTVSALTQSPTLDQQPYQADPTGQAILNILYTPPDVTTCPGYDPTKQTAPGNCVTVSSILNNTVPLPKNLLDYYNSQTNNMTSMVTILNENTLVTPLLISNSSTSSGSDVTVEQAATFIRYASGMMLPPTLPTAALLTQIMQANQDPILQQFIAKFRIYTAQVSVGLSNLYYILSKRLPQPDTDNQQTSQALNEYKMATWRLFNLNTSNNSTTPNTTWLDTINTANVTTIQKEMVTLLAEINYQLYLSRQQQERQLLTSSVSLLMSAQLSRPDVGAIEAALTQPVAGAAAPTPPPANTSLIPAQ